MFVFLNELGDVLKLRITVGRTAPGFDFANLSQAKVLFVHPMSNRIVASGRPQRVEFLLEPRWSQVGKDDLWIIWITGGSRFGQRLQILFDLGAGCNVFFRPAPDRRTRPATGSSSNESNSSIPRQMVLVEQPRILAT